MKKYLLPKEGQFYKANLHCHSTLSDGQYTPAELKTMYMEQGYSIIAYTDHDILIAHDELADENFLPLHAYEMEITEEKSADFTHCKCCHICMIALDPDNMTQVCWHRSRYLFGNASLYRDQVKFDDTLPDYVREYKHECITDMMRTCREKGFFVTYNHPAWSQENYNEYMGYHGMHAMEVFNSLSFADGYPDYNEKEYDDMLRGGERIYCIAADDSHGGLKGFYQGFTMIKADKLEYRTITDALVKGNFYASQGPRIDELWFEDGRLHVSCSQAATIVMSTAIRTSKVVRDSDHADFEVNPGDGYVRITVTDNMGKHANTNAYFTDELFGE